MIKLIHVITDSNIGGAGVWVLNFLKAYDRERYDVSVAVPQNSLLTPKIRELGVEVFEVAHIADKSFSKEGIKEFIKLFKEQKPDIVHCHASLSARIASKRLGIKTVNTRHCLEEKKSFPKNIIYSMINNALSDIVIGVSKVTCENLLDDGTKKEKVRLVYNGVAPLREFSDTEKKEIRKEYGINSDSIVVGIVARLEKVKNHELFLKAGKIVLEKYNNITLLIAGEGSERENIAKKAKELGIIDSVVFCGYQKDVSRIVNVIDIMALTSSKESLSLSLIEGMTLKKPCVSTASGGPEEVIENGVTGLLTDHTPEDFAKKASYYIDNPDQREKAGKEGKKRSKQIFSIEEMIKTLDEIYDELLKKGKKI